MEELLQIVKNIKEEMASQKTELYESITRNINANTNEKFKEMEKCTEKIETKIEYLEKQMKKRNVIFFGVSETERNYNDLERLVMEIIRNTMKIQFDKYELESVGRMGKFSKEKARPIIVTLTTLGRKIELLRNKKTLHNSSIYIKEDFTQKVLQKRKELQPELQEKRAQGLTAILKYDKIVILNRDNTEANQNKTNNKRNLSKSPELQNEQGKGIQNKTKFPKTFDMRRYATQKSQESPPPVRAPPTPASNKQ